MPVVWWLHDSAFFYEGIDKHILNGLNRENLQVYAVGPVARRALAQFLPDMEIGDLIYGVVDEAACCDKTNDDNKKICFVTIGYIEARKGQDIPEIIMTGTMDRKGIHDILECADVMVCPSREDPMPTVAAEAMMHKVSCIVLDATGTAEYICHKK